ncbi:unnamed protein product, partial [Symbiodinium sp. CCMP2592]
MSTSPSLLTTEKGETTEVSSDEMDDETRDRLLDEQLTAAGAGPMASSSGSQALDRIFGPVGPTLSPFVSNPTVDISNVQYTLYNVVNQGETAEQQRMAIERTEADAERRHASILNQQSHDNLVRMAGMAEQAERLHEVKMAECEAQFAEFEFNASQREKFLLNEVATCRNEMNILESIFQQRHQSEIAKLRTTLIAESERNKAQHLDFLGIRFKQVLEETEASMERRFITEIAEMSAQNDRLQDELAAAERALRMEANADEAGKQHATPKPGPNPTIPFSNPFEIPENMKDIFGRTPQAQEPPQGTSVPPGFENREPQKEKSPKAAQTGKPATVDPDGQAAPAKNDEKPRSPTPDPKAKKEKKHRGRSKSKEKSGGRTAACCISYALAAVPNGQGVKGDASGTFKKLRFKEKPSIREIPLDGKGKKHRTKPRTFEVCYLDAESCPKPPVQDLSTAIRTANELARIMSCMLNGIESHCEYECTDDCEEGEIPVAVLKIKDREAHEVPQLDDQNIHASDEEKVEVKTDFSALAFGGILG